MNVLLWVVQIALAVLYVAGGAYKVMSGGELANRFGFARGVWGALGVLEIVGGVLLVAPAALNWMPVLTPLAAGVLVLEALVLIGLYARRSLKLSANNPLPYALLQGV